MGVSIPYEVFQERLAERGATVRPEDLSLEERGQLIPLFGGEEELSVEASPQRSVRPRGVPNGVDIIQQVQDRIYRDAQASKWGQWRRAHLAVDHGDLEERGLDGDSSHLSLDYSAPIGRALADCLFSPVQQGVLMQGLSREKGDHESLMDEVRHRALWGTWREDSITMAEAALQTLASKSAEIREQVVTWLRAQGEYQRQRELDRQAYMAYAEAAG